MMKRITLLVLLSAAPLARAQQVFEPVQVMHTAPTGPCTLPVPTQKIDLTGDLYSCQNVTSGVGTWALLAPGSGGPPTGAAGGDLGGTYPNPSVLKLNGVALSGLATGILKNTTVTGVPSIAIAGTDYVTPSGNAATATNLSTNGTALQVWGMNSGATAQGWQTPSVTFTALTGDATSTSTGGATEVVGLLNNALPSLATGYLSWTGSAWALSSNITATTLTATALAGPIGISNTYGSLGIAVAGNGSAQFTNGVGFNFSSGLTLPTLTSGESLLVTGSAANSSAVAQFVGNGSAHAYIALYRGTNNAYTGGIQIGDVVGTTPTLRWQAGEVASTDFRVQNYGTGHYPIDVNISTDLVSLPYGVAAATYGTATNCSSSASPAVCAAAAAGSVVIAAGATSVVVGTTAVTANSQIQVTEDQSLGTKLAVTCNTGFLAAPPVISARTSGTSFTIAISASLATNPVCFSYNVTN